jgi:AcrR family transcriptional regulator
MARTAGGATTAPAEKILLVATDLFYDKSYGGVAVDEIGVAAGLTGPAIYRHFKGKGEILAALFDRAIDGLLSATGSTSSDPFADLAHRIKAHANYVLSQRKLAGIWIREGRSLSTEHRSRLRRRETSYVGQWVECIGRCFPHLSAQQCELAALTALGCINSVSNWPKTSSPQSLIETSISEFALFGLYRAGGLLDDFEPEAV